METGDGAEGASKDPLLALDTGAYVIDLSNEARVDAPALFRGEFSLGPFEIAHTPDCVQGAARERAQCIQAITLASSD